MTSSIYPLSVPPESMLPLSINDPLLTEDILITPAMLVPGGGGVLRLYFSVTFDTTIGDITILENSSEIGALNSDNNEEIATDGYYTFDLEVEANDQINLTFKGTPISSATEITAVNFIRAHLIVFGA